MNTKFEKKSKRLLAEAWLEEDRADKVDDRIFKGIKNEEMMEVSTGLFIDMEQTEGTWKEEDYDGIARNVRPDHLALLPDKVGACSLKDGAGLLRNESRHEPAWAGAKELLKRMGFGDLLKNEMSQGNTREALQRALRDRFKGKTPDGSTFSPNNYYPGPWVDDVYSDFFVFSWGEKLFRLSYTADDTGVTLSEDAPVEVARITEYRTVAGAKFVGNQDQPKQDNNNMDNKAKVIAAILAANVGWSDQKALEGLSEGQLKTIHNGIVKPEAAPAAPAAAATATPPAPVVPAATTNATPAPVVPATLESWLATVPPEIRAVVGNAMSTEKTEKANLIAAITANKESGFVAEDLQGMSVANLQKIAKLNATPRFDEGSAQFASNNYSGMAPTVPVTATNGAEEEGMALPTMNFSKAKAA